MLKILSIASIIAVITASTMKDGLNNEKMSRLINQRQKLLPQELLETTVPFIDTRSDAQIWFEAFKDPNERMRIFKAKTWDQLYHECKGSNEKIKDRVNSNLFIPFVKFDESFQKIIKILTESAVNNDDKFESLNLKDLKQLRSLQHLELTNVLSTNQALPDFNGWSDELKHINLENNNLIGSVSLTGFPKKLQGINLCNNKFDGDIILPGGYIPNSLDGYPLRIYLHNNPNANMATIKFHGTPHYDIRAYIDDKKGQKLLRIFPTRDNLTSTLELLQL